MLSSAGRAWWHDGLDDDPAGFTMTAQLVALAFDAMAPNELGRFWAHALRWQIRQADGVGVELEPTDATSFSLLFQSVAHAKVGQNRIHFDLTTTSVDDQNDKVAELLAIGARHVDIGQEPNDAQIVLADPESNEFCIIEPLNRFLASCPRLGAVNCDGTRALGCFFSEALGWPLVWDQDEETAIQGAGWHGSEDHVERSAAVAEGGQGAYPLPHRPDVRNQRAGRARSPPRARPDKTKIVYCKDANRRGSMSAPASTSSATPSGLA